MAKEKENVVDKPNEPTYPIQTFVDNAEALGYNKVIVTGALSICNKNEISKSEFEKIVKDFLGKKVK
ncbi:hypothetical protein [uncultured Clostridium sp.]|uniref:hypothetical protein n=1 Tax=uncultured Clostridium sp. TaxID=59620 RepID=UPI0028E57ECD|nr:hypothetical protein [uncultured Clostridium sp.]